MKELEINIKLYWGGYKVRIKKKRNFFWMKWYDSLLDLNDTIDYEKLSKCNSIYGGNIFFASILIISFVLLFFDEKQIASLIVTVSFCMNIIFMNFFGHLFKDRYSLLDQRLIFQSMVIYQHFVFMLIIGNIDSFKFPKYWYLTVCISTFIFLIYSIKIKDKQIKEYFNFKREEV